jgi:hypothetical protein
LPESDICPPAGSRSVAESASFVNLDGRCHHNCCLIFADLFRRYGFLAPVTARLSFYLVWHIIFAGLT